MGTVSNISGHASLLRRLKEGSLTVVSGKNELRVYREENGQPNKIAVISETEAGTTIKVLAENVTVER